MGIVSTSSLLYYFSVPSVKNFNVCVLGFACFLLLIPYHNIVLGGKKLIKTFGHDYNL